MKIYKVKALVEVEVVGEIEAKSVKDLKKIIGDECLYGLTCDSYLMGGSNGNLRTTARRRKVSIVKARETRKDKICG